MVLGMTQLEVAGCGPPTTDTHGEHHTAGII